MRRTAIAVMMLLTAATGALGSQRETYRAHGRIVDAMGNPAAAARLTVYRITYDQTGIGAADVEARQVAGYDGSYSFNIEGSGAVDRKYCIVAQKPGRAIGWANFSGDSEFYADITLGQAGKLAGVVVDSNDMPVENAVVMAGPATAPVPNAWTMDTSVIRKALSTRTDSRGRFEFRNLPVGRNYDLSATHPDFGMYFRHLAEEDWWCGLKVGTEDIVVRMPGRTTIAGKVIDKSSGKPVEGVRVRILLNEFVDPVVSDKNGNFMFPIVTGREHRIIVLPESGDTGPAARVVTAKVEAGQTVDDVRVELEEGGRLEVKVVDEQGRALDEATVFAGQDCPVGSSGSVYMTTMRATDSDGKVVFRLPEGEHQIQRIMKPGYVSIEKYRSVSVQTGKTVRLRYVLKKARIVAGKVVDKSGRAVTGVHVYLSPSNSRSFVWTDNLGRFSFLVDHPQDNSAYPARASLLIASDLTSNRCTVAEVVNADDNVLVQLQPAIRLTGRVVDEQGKAVPDVVAVVGVVPAPLKEDGRPVSITVAGSYAGAFYSNAEGLWQVPCIPVQSDCVVRLMKPGLRSVTEEVKTPKATGKPFDVGTIIMRRWTEADRKAIEAELVD